MYKEILKKNTTDLGESISLLGYLAELHEWDNRKHLERFSRYVFQIAMEMGLSETDAATLSLASQLHDIGKFYTPKELLLAMGNLSAKDWVIIEKHTTQGGQLLQENSSIVMQTAAKIALTHHERWDGSGYPRGLKGEDIPLSGCVCAVVDVFDALTTYRAYKEVVNDEAALELIMESSGTLFNPEVVNAFEKVFPEIQKIKKACE